MKSNLVRAALAALALSFSMTAAMAASDPIPGVDIIVRKNPGGLAVVVATTDAKGKFSARVAEPGNYALSTACHPKTTCLGYTGTVTFTVTLGPTPEPITIAGQEFGTRAKAVNLATGTTSTFSVGKTPTVISGMLRTTK